MSINPSCQSNKALYLHRQARTRATVNAHHFFLFSGQKCDLEYWKCFGVKYFPNKPLTYTFVRGSWPFTAMVSPPRCSSTTIWQVSGVDCCQSGITPWMWWLQDAAQYVRVSLLFSHYLIDGNRSQRQWGMRLPSFHRPCPEWVGAFCPFWWCPSPVAENVRMLPGQKRPLYSFSKNWQFRLDSSFTKHQDVLLHKLNCDEWKLWKSSSSLKHANVQVVGFLSADVLTGPPTD